MAFPTGVNLRIYCRFLLGPVNGPSPWLSPPIPPAPLGRCAEVTLGATEGAAGHAGGKYSRLLGKNRCLRFCFLRVTQVVLIKWYPRPVLIFLFLAPANRFLFFRLGF